MVQNTMYEMYPVVDQMKCDKHKISNSLSSGQSSVDSRKLLQADDDKPQLGFVSFPDTMCCTDPVYEFSRKHVLD